jgi:murein DD-endopeptidase MepM/ murein hydrolase activator NlpD
MQKLKLSGWWVLLAVPLLALLFWHRSLANPAAPAAVTQAGFLGVPPTQPRPPALTLAPTVQPTPLPPPADPPPPPAHAALLAQPARISSEFGHYPNGGAHYGVDIAVATGTEVFAPVGGTVLHVQRECVEGVSSCGSGFGNHVWFTSVETGHAIVVAHLDALDEWVQEGATFAAGQRFGLAGNTGNSTGPHIHLQVHPEGRMANAGATNAAWEFPWLACQNPDGKLGELFGGNCEEGAAVPPSSVVVTCTDYANPRCGKLDGTAAYYDKGVMQLVLRNRGMPARPDLDGYAAVTDCSLIRKVAVASIMGGAPERFLIADCSATQDLATQISRRQVIEVDWETAVRHGLHKVGRGPATLLRIED